MRVGSLFAGIGGFDLGLSWAGYDIAWQVEQDEWCRKVLAKHWPDVARFTDVCDCGLHNLEPVDVICGGFPCQDISLAGRQAGLDGERSSLWWEMRRIVGELRPPYVIVENVPNLFIRGFDRVLGSLSEIGYDAEWGVISANDVGAPHLRQRLWIVAYPCGSESGVQECGGGGQGRQPTSALPSTLLQQADGTDHATGAGTGGAVAYPIGARGEARDGDGLGNGNGSYRHQGVAVGQGGEGGADAMAHTDSVRQLQPQGSKQDIGRRTRDCGLEERRGKWQDGNNDHWLVEPELGRVANGIPDRVDRLRGLGNAIVPQIAYWLGTRIKDGQ